MKLQKLFLALTTSHLLSDSYAQDQLVDDSVLNNLLGKTFLNRKETRQGVRFHDPLVDPYPKLWYNTKIDVKSDCFVEYPILPDGNEDRTQYNLRSYSNATYEDIKNDPRADVALYRTHRLHCGVCSNLQDLHVYLKYPDLTSPVKKCTSKIQDKSILSCLYELGFSEDCSRIWFWNAKNTRKTHANGGCLGTCLPRAFSANNSPKGTFNPCKPFVKINEDKMKLSKSNRNLFESRHLNWLSINNGKSGVETEVQKEKNKRGFCGNKINGKPACHERQWKDGPYRLNACLQCDECRSGPIFQLVAGRTRRNSGIQSAIWRPDVFPLNHDYA
eukprot:snap_masked-scaffold_41-processed-gene-2.46-mRNA-1 protein AED:0.18 eAED:0.23 QI:0/-1/0/1/-1/1/1/0/330